MTPEPAKTKLDRLVAYERVSTDKQAMSGVSLDVQVAKFRAYGIAHDVEIVAIQSDALSGKNTHRPGLQAALAMLERGEADGLLVAKLDRLTRSVRDMEDLVETYFAPGRYKLFCVEESIDTRTAIGRFVLRLHANLAQLERERLAERTKEALDHLRKTGGGIPRIEGATVGRMLALEADGRTLREIAEQLTNEGVPTLKGGRWQAETVRRVLARARGQAA